MKRFLAYSRTAVLVVLCLVLMSTAFAEGLFSDTLPTLSVEYISYGVRMGVEPSFTQTQENGSTKEVYTSVSVDDYYAFGNILGEQGYAIAEQNQTESGVNLTLVKEDARFQVAYDMAEETLSVTYPKDAKVEQPEIPDPFPGYTRIEFGDAIKVGKSIMKFDEFHFFDEEHSITEDVVSNPESRYGFLQKHYEHIGTWLKGTFDNREVASVAIGPLCSTALWYINEDNAYTYDGHALGIFNTNGELAVSRGTGFYSSYRGEYDTYVWSEVLSLRTCDIGGTFLFIPDRVKNAKDGILAITFDFTDGGKYVLYIREQ